MECSLVSVIIPTYKRADRLKNAIDSLLNQTYKNLEIIVVDDNNPSSSFRFKTEEIMDEYVGNNKVKYLQHEKNKNGAAARNTGINIAKGEFIGFLDDDDLYLPRKIETQVNFLVSNFKYNAVYCGRFQNGRAVYGEFSGDLSKEILTLKFTPTTPALLFRRTSIYELGGFNEQFKRHQDFELLLRYFKKNDIGVISEPLVIIGSNAGENELHGVQLEETKTYFFKQFHAEIERVSRDNEKIRNSIFIAHYIPVIFDHISQKLFEDAYRIYIRGIKKSFTQFNIAAFNYIIKYLKIKVTRKLDKKQYFIEGDGIK